MDKKKFAKKLALCAPLWRGNREYWAYFIYKNKTYVFNHKKIDNGYQCRRWGDCSPIEYKHNSPEEAILDLLEKL